MYYWIVEFWDVKKRTWMRYGSPMAYSEAYTTARILSESGWKTRIRKEG